MRQALELSTTTQPASREPRRPLARHAAAGGEERDVEALDRVVGAARAPRAARRRTATVLPGGALGGERHDLARAKRRSRITSSIVEPTAPVAPTTATARARSSRASPSSRSTSSSPELERVVQRPHGVGHALGGDHAGDLDRRGGDHLDVDLLSRRGSRTPSPRRRGGCACPRPRPRPCPSRSFVITASRPSSPVSASSERRAMSRSDFGTVKEISALRSVDTGSFWTIMSTFTSASASAPKMRAGDTGPVRHARERDAGVLGRMRHGCDERSFHGLVLAENEGTGAVAEARPHVDAHAVVARVLDRAQLQHLRAGGRHLEHLLERQHRAACGRPARSAGRPRRRRRRRCRSRTRPRPAPPRARPPSCPSRPGRASSRRGRSRRPGSPPPARSLPSSSPARMRSARTSRIRAFVCDVSVTIPACEPDSEIASRAQVVERHRAQRARDALAGREQHVHLARVRLGRDLVRHLDQLVGGGAARRQHGHDGAARPRRARTMRLAAPIRRSASATEVPPNFITTMPLELMAAQDRTEPRAPPRYCGKPETAPAARRAGCRRAPSAPRSRCRCRSRCL